MKRAFLTVTTLGALALASVGLGTAQRAAAGEGGDERPVAAPAPPPLPVPAPALAAKTSAASTSALAALSGAHKEAVVASINGLRSTLGATSMKKMSWDDNLAAFAAKQAAGCALVHSSNGDRSAVTGWVGTYVGENIAAGSETGMTLADAKDAKKVQGYLDEGLGNWWLEKANFDIKTNTCKAGATCGHFTQMAWAETAKIGCAVAVCAPQKALGTTGYTLYCEFGVGGNVNGQRPWTPAVH